MALSFAQYSGDGTNRNFSVPFPYIDRSHISVSVNGVSVPFSFLSQSVVQTATAPAPGTAVDVRRTTPSNISLVDFVDASTLLESDLDLSALQTLYVSQETKDDVDNAIGLTLVGTYDAQNRRMVNVGAPTDPNDAARKADVDGVVASAGAASAASAAAALASQNAAAASATQANNVVTSGTVGAVRHDVVQSLTGPQQAQARSNIGISATNTPFTPAGNIAATHVQAALAELDTEKALLAGSASQTFLVAAASANDHAVSRAFGDGRYARITTSPTALTAGATIPSTENGRFYSLALPTAQTCALPSTTGLPDGFSCVLRATGNPSAFQQAFVNGNGKTVYYRGNNLALFYLIGAGEIFRFTWLSGMDLWVAECLAQPQLGVTGNIGSNTNAWSTTPTAWTPLAAYSSNSNSFHVNFQLNSSCIQVAAAGLYSMLGYVQYSSGSGGGVSGVGYIAGGTNTGADTGRGISQHLFNTTDGDGATLQAGWTEALQPQDLRMVWFISSVSGLYTYLAGNYFIIRLIGR